MYLLYFLSSFVVQYLKKFASKQQNIIVYYINKLTRDSHPFTFSQVFSSKYTAFEKDALQNADRCMMSASLGRQKRKNDDTFDLEDTFDPYDEGNSNDPTMKKSRKFQDTEDGYGVDIRGEYGNREGGDGGYGGDRVVGYGDGIGGYVGDRGGGGGYGGDRGGGYNDIRGGYNDNRGGYRDKGGGHGDRGGRFGGDMSVVSRGGMRSRGSSSSRGGPATRQNPTVPAPSLESSMSAMMMSISNELNRESKKE